MPALEKPKWEAMARNLARGMVQEEAHAQAGFARHSGAASRMANHPEIVARVEEIRNEREAILAGPSVIDEGEENDHGDNLFIVNETWVIQQLAKNVVSAQQVGNHSAANKALEMLGQHLGMSFADSKAKAADGSNPSLGQGNTFNFMAVNDMLTNHRQQIEQKTKMKDITPPAPPGDNDDS